MSVCCLRESSFCPAHTISRQFLENKEIQRQRAFTTEESRAHESLLQQAVKMSNAFTDRLSTLRVKYRSKPKEQLPRTVPVDSADVIDTDSAAECTQVQEQSDSDYDDLEDVLHESVLDMSRFGRAGTKHAAMNWFKQTQMCNVKVPNQSRFSEWFHGIISRKEAERLLKDRVVGCFLIRVSESRFGYSLSFKDEKRCRHYMIDQLRNGKFIIIGEPKVHSSLHELIDYHMKVKISNWNQFLTVPCGQDKDESDYAELVSGVYFEVENQPQVQDQSSRVSDHLSCGYSLQRPNRQPAPVNILHKSNSLATFVPNLAKRPLPKLPEEDCHKEESTRRSLNDHESRKSKTSTASTQRRASVV